MNVEEITEKFDTRVFVDFAETEPYGHFGIFKMCFGSGAFHRHDVAITANIAALAKKRALPLNDKGGECSWTEAFFLLPSFDDAIRDHAPRRSTDEDPRTGDEVGVDGGERGARYQRDPTAGDQAVGHLHLGPLVDVHAIDHHVLQEDGDTQWFVVASIVDADVPHLDGHFPEIEHLVALFGDENPSAFHANDLQKQTVSKRQRRIEYGIDVQTFL